MEKIRKMIARLYGNDVVRYVFFGGCTTLVNLVSFYVLRKCGLQLTVDKYNLYHCRNSFCLYGEFKVRFSGQMRDSA